MTRARLAAVAVILVGATATLVLNLPGHLSYDSVVQLAQGRAGIYNSWHPPIMAWMLGLADAALRGTALFVVFDVLLLFGALAWLVVLGGGRPGTWAAPMIALAMILTPQWLIYPGIVWKDVLFAGSSLMGCAALAQACASWPHRRVRLAFIALAVLFMALAALARQNGAVVPLFGAIALGLVAGQSAPRRPRLRGLGYGLAAFAGVLTIMVGATLALDLRNDGEPAQLYELEDLQVFDLSGAVQLDPTLPMDRLRAANPRLEQLIRTDGADAWDPRRIDPLAALKTLHVEIRRTPPAAIAGQWRDLIFGRPDLYLRVRSTDFAWVVLTPDIHECLPFFVGVDGPQPVMRKLGLVRRMGERDSVLKAYGSALASTPMFSHALFGLLALVVLAGLVRRRRPADIVLAAMILSALAFSASFFIVSVACDYRYLYFLDVSAMAGALYLAAGGAQRKGTMTPRGR